jgi:hypothetical protein
VRLATRLKTAPLASALFARDERQVGGGMRLMRDEEAEVMMSETCGSPPRGTAIGKAHRAADGATTCEAYGR